MIKKLWFFIGPLNQAFQAFTQLQWCVIKPGGQKYRISKVWLQIEYYCWKLLMVRIGGSRSETSKSLSDVGVQALTCERSWDPQSTGVTCTRARPRERPQDFTQRRLRRQRRMKAALMGARWHIQGRLLVVRLSWIWAELLRRQCFPVIYGSTVSLGHI